MNLIRIIIALAILILGSLVLQFAIAPFSIGNGTFQITHSISRVAGGIIWGVIIWGIIKLFRGDEKSPDMSSFIFYTAAIYIVLLTVTDFFIG
jgi:hypothetical protein